MEHRERYALAVRMIDEHREERGGGVLVGGAYGSTARGTDTAHSDLELFFITDGSDPLESWYGMRSGVPIAFRSGSLAALEHEVRNPTVEWPFLMGILDALKVLRGDEGIVARLLEYGRSVEQQKFDVALQAALPGLVFESWGRIRSCVERDDRYALRAVTIEVVLEMVRALSLLNRGWVTHDYFDAVRDTRGFPLLPRDFEQLASDLWLEDDPERAADIADELVDNFLAVLRSQPAFRNMEL